MITYQKIYIFNASDYLISEINKNLDKIVGTEYFKLLQKTANQPQEIKTFFEFIKFANNLHINNLISEPEIKNIFINVANNVRNQIRETLSWRYLESDKLYEFFMFECFIYEKGYITSKTHNIPSHIISNRDVDFLERAYYSEIKKVMWNNEKESHYVGINKPLSIEETNNKEDSSESFVKKEIKNEDSKPNVTINFDVKNIGRLQVTDFIAYINSNSSKNKNDIVLYLSGLKTTARSILMNELRSYPFEQQLIEIKLYSPFRKFKLSKELFELIAKQHGVIFNNLDLSHAFFTKRDQPFLNEIELENQLGLPTYIANFLKNKYHNIVERKPLVSSAKTFEPIIQQSKNFNTGISKTKTQIYKAKPKQIEQFSSEAVKSIEFDIKKRYNNQEFNIIISDYQNSINNNFLVHRNEYISKTSLISILTKDNLFKLANQNLAVNTIIYNDFNNQYINGMRSIILGLPTGIYSYNYFLKNHEKLILDYEINSFNILKDSLLTITNNPDYMFEEVNDLFFIKNIISVEEWFKQEIIDNNLNTRTERKNYLSNKWNFDDKEIENFLNIYSNIEINSSVSNEEVEYKFNVEDLYRKSTNLNVNFDDDNIDKIYKFLKEDKRLFYTSVNIKNLAQKIEYKIDNVEELISSIVSKDVSLSKFKIGNETIITMISEINDFEKWLEFIVDQYFNGYNEVDLEELFDQISKNHPWSININKFIDFVSEYQFKSNKFEYDEYNDSLKISY